VSKPYRTTAEDMPQPVPPTDSEIALWDAVAVALAGCPACSSHESAVAWADRIVAKRRERFGAR